MFKFTPPQFLKKLNKFLLLALLYSTTAKAQTFCDTTYNIRTAVQDVAWPFNAVNTQRPPMTNVFHWTAPQFNWRTALFPATNAIASPFYQGSNANVTHFILPADTLKRDFRPEDGWELIKMDFGFNWDGTPIPTGTPNPYFTMYNKYTGTLRVFFARGELNESANRAMIRVGFPISSNTPSGYIQNSTFDLGLGNGPMALDKSFDKKDSSFFYSSVRYIDNYFLWMYADFPVTYDPCTCFYNSLLNISVDLVKNSTIIQKGTLNGTIETIQNNNATQTDAEYSSLRKAFNKVSPIAKKYVEVGTGIQGFINKYKKSADSSGRSNPLKFFKKFSLDVLATELKKSKFLKAGLNAVPLVKEALNIMEFFVGGGKEDKGPQPVELMPMSINAEITLNGKIETFANKLNLDISMPGSISTGINNATYPYFNNALGIFNLLYTPRINYTMEETFIPGGGPRSGGHTEQIRMYQFATPIQYVLNPGAGLEVALDSATGKEDIQVAMIIPRGVGVGNNLTPWRSNDPNMKWSYFYRDEKKELDLFGTDYSFASCIGDSIYSMIKTNQYQNEYLIWPRTQNAFIKVLVNLKRKNGIGQNVLFSATYPAVIDTLNTIADFRFPTTTCDNQVFIKADSGEIVKFCTGSSSPYVLSDRFLRRNPDVTIVTESGSSIINATLFPNPVTNTLTASFTLAKPSFITMDIIDINGKRIGTPIQNRYYSASTFTTKIPVEKLASGTYFVVFTNETRKVLQQYKFIKLK